MTPSPDAVFADLGASLADLVEEALPGWVERSVARTVTAATGSPPAAEVVEAAAEAGRRAAAEVGPPLRALVAADVDDQKTTPLALIRAAVRFPTAVLAATGMAEVERDPFAVRAFPLDVYDLSPASFADLGPEVAELGLAWGAAKAFVHRRRHPTP